jgi:hypothetical protein
MAAITATLSGVAAAQIGGFLKSATSESKGSAVDFDKVVAQGQDLLVMITLATDLGVEAAEHLADVYPPEKVEQIRLLSAQYNELKTKRGSGNVDAEELKLASEIFAETAKLERENNWKKDRKDNAREVRKAYGKLGVMLIVDAVAGTQIPPTVDALKNAVSEIAKHPLSGVSKAAQIRKQIAVLIAVPGAAVSQVQSAKSVRRICTQIAKAEKFSLGADPPADSIKNVTDVKNSTRNLDEPESGGNPAVVASVPIAPSQLPSGAQPKDKTHEPAMATRSPAPEPPPTAISTQVAPAVETSRSKKGVVSPKETVVDVAAPEPAEKTHQAVVASVPIAPSQLPSGAQPKDETHEPTTAARSSAPEPPPAAISTQTATLSPAPAPEASVVPTGQTTRVEGPDAEMVGRLGIAIRQIARRGSCVQCRRLLQRTGALGALVEAAQDSARTLDEYEALVKDIARLQHG